MFMKSEISDTEVYISKIIFHSCNCIFFYITVCVSDYISQYPWEIIRSAWEMGLINSHIPQHCGELTTWCYHLCGAREGG